MLLNHLTEINMFFRLAFFDACVYIKKYNKILNLSAYSIIFDYINTHEITELGRRLVTWLMVFHGVFAADTFIEALDFNNTFTAAYIVNTEPLQLRGRHWVAIIQEPGVRFEIFDPLGHGPWEYANFNIFNAVAFNSHKLRNPLTNTSGHISLLHLYFRSRGYSFRYAIK